MNRQSGAAVTAEAKEILGSLGKLSQEQLEAVFIELHQQVVAGVITISPECKRICAEVMRQAAGGKTQDAHRPLTLEDIDGRSALTGTITVDGVKAKAVLFIKQFVGGEREDQVAGIGALGGYPATGPENEAFAQVIAANKHGQALIGRLMYERWVRDQRGAVRVGGDGRIHIRAGSEDGTEEAMLMVFRDQKDASGNR